MLAAQDNGHSLCKTARCAGECTKYLLRSTTCVCCCITHSSCCFIFFLFWLQALHKASLWQLANCTSVKGLMLMLACQVLMLHVCPTFLERCPLIPLKFTLGNIRTHIWRNLLWLVHVSYDQDVSSCFLLLSWMQLQELYLTEFPVVLLVTP